MRRWLRESCRYQAGSESRARRDLWGKAGGIGTNECSKAKRMYELLLILNKGNCLSSV